jgi:hypothetical protein
LRKSTKANGKGGAALGLPSRRCPAANGQQLSLVFRALSADIITPKTNFVNFSRKFPEFFVTCRWIEGYDASIPKEVWQRFERLFQASFQILRGK